MENKVRRLIEKRFKRSLCIARETRPRDLGGDAGTKRNWEELGRLAGYEEPEPAAQFKVNEYQGQSTWGTVKHDGWSSPSTSDLPDLGFMPVIMELPNLIEAKAVSLAPGLDGPEEERADSNDEDDEGEGKDNIGEGTDKTEAEDHAIGDTLPERPAQDAALSVKAHPPHPQKQKTSHPSASLPDPLAMEILQRPQNMNLRDYLFYLSSLNLLPNPSSFPPTSSNILQDFLALYEKARFSPYPLSETSFRQLMELFASLLRSMNKVDEDAFANVYAAAAAAEENGGRGGDGISLYSTTSYSSSNRSFITTGDMRPRLSTFTSQADAPNYLPHKTDASSSLHTTSTVEHHHQIQDPEYDSGTLRPPLQRYITTSSYQSAQPELLHTSSSASSTRPVSSDSSIVPGRSAQERSPSGRQSSGRQGSTASLATHEESSTDLESVIRLSEEGGGVLDLPLVEGN